MPRVRYKYIGTMRQLKELGFTIDVSFFDGTYYATSGVEGRDKLFIVFDETNYLDRIVQYNLIPRNNMEEIDKKLILELLFNDLVEVVERWRDTSL